VRKAIVGAAAGSICPRVDLHAWLEYRERNWRAAQLRQRGDIRQADGLADLSIRGLNGHCICLHLQNLRGFPEFECDRLAQTRGRVKLQRLNDSLPKSGCFLRSTIGAWRQGRKYIFAPHVCEGLGRLLCLLLGCRYRGVSQHASRCVLYRTN
jgi:hypothetical protein